MAEKHNFQKETDLCAAFINAMPEGWTAYPETCGFDILLVRKEDGFQIGIEAKLKLNTKVICQVAEPVLTWYTNREGPDCRAVLIPAYAATELAAICQFLGITVIRQYHPSDAFHYRYNNRPSLPELHRDWPDSDWYEFAPARRCAVPDYIPDVIAGDSAPVTLTVWKIAAIKIAITIERRGYVTRQDFSHYDISMSRWTQGGWLIKDGKGGWIKGPYFPDFKAQHPVNYEQIAADYEVWKSPEQATQPSLISS